MGLNGSNLQRVLINIVYYYVEFVYLDLIIKYDQQRILPVCYLVMQTKGLFFSHTM